MSKPILEKFSKDPILEKSSWPGDGGPDGDPDPILEKSSWPELVGQMGTQVATTIAHERPDVAVEVLPPGSPTLPGYNPKRVRVWINYNGVVYSVPVIG